MSMTDVFRSLGRADALKLRGEASSLTGTQIIDREVSIPAWRADADYSTWPAGSPVTDEGQVWTLIQPHNAAHYAQRPAKLRALWGIAHTTNPARAKPWMDAYGTSGMYQPGECYKDENGIVQRVREGYKDVIHPASEYPQAWEAVNIE